MPYSFYLFFFTFEILGFYDYLKYFPNKIRYAISNNNNNFKYTRSNASMKIFTQLNALCKTIFQSCWGSSLVYLVLKSKTNANYKFTPFCVSVSTLFYLFMGVYISYHIFSWEIELFYSFVFVAVLLSYLGSFFTLPCTV